MCKGQGFPKARLKGWQAFPKKISADLSRLAPTQQAGFFVEMHGKKLADACCISPRMRVNTFPFSDDLASRTNGRNYFPVSLVLGAFAPVHSIIFDVMREHDELFGGAEIGGQSQELHSGRRRMHV
jgi:hypothetical protein